MFTGYLSDPHSVIVITEWSDILFHDVYAVWIDIGDKESVATYMSPSGDIIEQFTFEMKDSGYNEFCERYLTIPLYWTVITVPFP